MTTDEIQFDAEERMEKAVGVFQGELRGLRTGRATPALVDSIRVEYYGSPTPLKQLAQINCPDPQSIVIRPFDAGCLKDIEKAIRSSDLGMSPNNGFQSRSPPRGVPIEPGWAEHRLSLNRWKHESGWLRRSGTSYEQKDTRSFRVFRLEMINVIKANDS